MVKSPPRRRGHRDQASGRKSRPLFMPGAGFAETTFGVIASGGNLLNVELRKHVALAATLRGWLTVTDRCSNVDGVQGLVDGV